MAPGPYSPLSLPSFLRGSYSEVQQKAHEEGLRCGRQYLKESCFPLPQALLEVPPGEVVVANDAVDFNRKRPAWRLHRVPHVLSGLSEALDWQDTNPLRDAYEAFCRETTWGALYFAIGRTSPHGSERMSLRFQSLLRFWEPLESVRYLFSSPSTALTLGELAEKSCSWATDAWCPVGGDSVRERLKTAVERMSRATREDSMEAILRQLSRVLILVRDLKHREAVADPSFLRQRLSLLDSAAFERVSGAHPGSLIEKLYDWDHELGTH